jgi:hypothetical protein
MLQSQATFQQASNNLNTPSKYWMNETSKQNIVEEYVRRK